jgi:hypothetical protein
MMANFFIGLFLALLPTGYRKRSLANWHGDLRTSAMFSGSAQMLLALGTLMVRYPRFAEKQIAQIDPRVFLSAAERGGETAVSGFGAIMLIAYILTPLSILLVYFAFEGGVRVLGAVSTGEVVGSLPLTLLEIGMGKWSARREEKKQGPRVPDLVTSAPVNGSGYDLAVASCRCKPGWDHLMTISYDEKLYELADYLEGDLPRKHVYLLRFAPPHKVVRGLHHFDPEEVMNGK